MSPEKRKLLGEIFLENGLIDEQTLEKALDASKKKGVLLGQRLLSKDQISEDDLAKALSVQLGYPYVSLKDISISREILDLVSENIVKRYKIIPISKINNKLRIGMTNPQDKQLIGELEYITKIKIDPCVCTASDVFTFMDKYFGEPGNLQNFLVPKKKKNLVRLAQEEYHYTTTDGHKICNQIIGLALEKNVRKVHLEPLRNSLRVRFRSGHSLTEALTYNKQLSSVIISTFKRKGGLDVAKRDCAQEGKFTAFHSQGKMQETSFLTEGERVEIIVSSIPSLLGECITLEIALQGNERIKPLTELGAELKDETRIKKLLLNKHGIVFIAGPPESGKTTTLYTLLKMKSNPSINIFSIEDTITNQIDGVNQVETKTFKTLAPEEIVEAVLKHNPQILAFDTVLNKKTAELMVRASLAKCLVIAPIDAANTLDAIPLLSCLGLSPYILSSSITGIIGQKQFKTICQHCKEELDIEEITGKLLHSPYNGKITTAFCGRGCAKCSNTGFKGSISVFEVISLNDEAKKLIANGVSSDHLKSFYHEEKLRTITEKLIEHINEGIIDLHSLI